MLTKCSNPVCKAPFDYREGRLVRLSRISAGSRPVENQRVIEHFWFCAACAGLYVFEYELGMIVRIKPRHRESSKENLSYFVSAA